MMSLRAILFLLCVLACAGCGDRRARAEGALKNGGAERLRREAALLYKDMYSRSGRPAFVEIEFKNWPKSFQKLRPTHVGAYRDGFTIALYTANSGESGLYVVPESMDYEPKNVPGVSFQKLADGVFWFQFGK
jgi:hypothetical protein